MASVVGKWAGRLAQRRHVPGAWLAEQRYGLVFAPPCYYLKPLREGAVVIDCGTGHDANLSRALMARFGARCFGVDPTPKHAAGLKVLEREAAGQFTHIAAAVGACGRRARFFESAVNESGSLFDDHVNVRNDPVSSHEVAMIALDRLLDLAGSDLELLKLDIEGAEYEVLAELPDQRLTQIPQLIVEFHHDLVERWRRTDTEAVIQRLAGLGFESHTRDGFNHLFLFPETFGR